MNNRSSVLLLAFFYGLALPAADCRAAAMDWYSASPAAAWAGREEFRVEYFNGQYYLMGGYTGPALTDVQNDVWSSADGVNWTQVAAHAPWPARYGHTSAVFNGKLWVMGGMVGHSSSYATLNDVWYTDNGTTWTQAPNAGWSTRASLRAVTYNGKMWVIAGWGSAGFSHDVWSTTNGTAWTQVTANAPWSMRCAVGLADFQGKLWLYGGGIGSSVFNDVWWTTDGANWTQESPSGPMWPGRQHHTICIFNNKLWVMGGWYWTTTAAYRSDVWYSADGINWTEDTPMAPWAARSSHQALSVGGRVMLWGGVTGSGYRSDVWAAPVVPVPVGISKFTLE